MAIKINVNKVLAEAERRNREPAPLPKVSVKRKPSPADREPAEATAPPPNDLLKGLWDKMAAVKKERAKLSTRTAFLVDEVHALLRDTEGPTVAQEFMLGNIPHERITAHWAEIQSLTAQAIALYDQIKYVEQYGHLPRDPEPDPMIKMCTPDISIMQLELNRLRDLICKTRKKIEVGKAYNPNRITEWHEKLALAEARREDLRLKIKKSQYDARAKRTDQ